MPKNYSLLDADDMAGATDTSTASSESIKAYVDSVANTNIGTDDLTIDDASRSLVLNSGAGATFEISRTGGASYIAKFGSTTAWVEGNLVLSSATGTNPASKIYFREGANYGTNYVAIKAPDDLSSTDTIYTLPPDYPTTGQVLSSTDAGVMSWENAGSVSVSDSVADTAFPVVFHDESNNLHDDTGAFTYNPSTGGLVTSKLTAASRKYELPSVAVGDFKGGDVYYYGDGSTVKGGIYYINGTNWTLADADAESSASGLLAVALGTVPVDDGMLLRGFVTLLTEIEGTEAIGSPIYLSATNSGKATITAPTGDGDIVRVLGYSLHATGNQVYFNPDNTFVEYTT